MKLDVILQAKHKSDIIGRASWYNKKHGYMVRLTKRPGGWHRFNIDEDGKRSMDPYTLTDEDRLADDWMIVQTHDDPNPTEDDKYIVRGKVAPIGPPPERPLIPDRYLEIEEGSKE